MCRKALETCDLTSAQKPGSGAFDSAASLRAYFAEIGAKGGRKSRRKIAPEQQAAMQEARKAAKLRKGTNAKLSGRGLAAEPRSRLSSHDLS